MPYRLYASVDDLIAPATLRTLTGVAVESIRSWPLSLADGTSHSGSPLQCVEATGDGVHRFVLKRISMDHDYSMRATQDTYGRPVRLWQYGILDRLLPEIDHAILACSRDGERGWAILMRDVSAALFSPGDVPGAEDMYCLLDAWAALHARYWQEPALANPDLGLCDVRGLVHQFAPETMRSLLHMESRAPKMVVEGWELLQKQVAPDVAETLRALFTDPQPLCDALEACPKTLVHGNLRMMNLGLWRQTDARQVVLFDWSNASYGPATADLVWFLDKGDTLRSSVAYEEAVAYYRDRLGARLGERFDAAGWQRLLDVGALANVMRMGSIHAWITVHHKEEAIRRVAVRAVEGYNDQVRAGMQWL